MRCDPSTNLWNDLLADALVQADRGDSGLASLASISRQISICVALDVINPAKLPRLLVPVVNFYDHEIGNAAIPSKLAQAEEASRAAAKVAARRSRRQIRDKARLNRPRLWLEVTTNPLISGLF